MCTHACEEACGREPSTLDASDHFCSGGIDVSRRRHWLIASSIGYSSCTDKGYQACPCCMVTGLHSSAAVRQPGQVPARTGPWPSGSRGPLALHTAPGSWGKVSAQSLHLETPPHPQIWALSHNQRSGHPALSTHLVSFAFLT